MGRSRQTAGADARVRRWVIGGAVLYLTIFVLLLSRPVNHSDEAWFLWIAHRVAGGQVLYRDVYSVTTPLPTWVAAAGVWLFGTQLLVVRALSVACITASALLALSIAGRCGLSRRGRALLLVSIVLIGSPLAHFASIYSQLAITGAMATLALLLAWLELPTVAPTPTPGTTEASRRSIWRIPWPPRGPSRRLLMGAGVAAGLSFASKPNIGMLTLLAAVAVVVTHGSWRDRRVVASQVALVVAPFAVVVGLMLAVIGAQGAFGPFVSDVFSDKPEYLRALGVAFPPGRAQIERLFTGAQGFSAFLDTQGLVMTVAVGVVVWAMRVGWRSQQAVGVALTSFAVVGVLAAYPQAGPQHLTEAAPLVLATMAAAAGLLARSAPTRARHWVRHGVVVVLTTWLAVGGVLLAGVLAESAPYATGNDNPQHFAGTIAYDAHWHSQFGALHRLRRVTGGTVFILSADASFYYLAGGLRDPLPYDFPVISDFGGGGERGITRRIAAGHARWICIGHRPRHAGLGPAVHPVRLERWIRHHLPFVAHLQFCDLYRGRRAHRAPTTDPGEHRPEPDGTELDEQFTLA